MIDEEKYLTPDILRCFLKKSIMTFDCLLVDMLEIKIKFVKLRTFIMHALIFDIEMRQEYKI